MGSSNCVELVLKCLRRNTFQRCKYLPIPNWQIIPRNVRNSMSMTSKLYAEIDKTVKYKHWNKQLKKYSGTMNRMRKNKLFPRQVSDIGAFLFVVIMMPATYIYETAIVVPAIYSSGIYSCVRAKLEEWKFFVKIIYILSVGPNFK